jgi:predicted DNA binding CopG/RHH family protein
VVLEDGLSQSKSAEAIIERAKVMSKPKHTGFDAPYFDDEEREIMEALERGEFKPSDRPLEEIKAEWQEIVRNTKRKKAITVRIQEGDIAKLKVRALQKGMPYQTLIASILHQYAEGALKEDV